MEYQYEKQHNKGKLHAIERINLLLDRESFVEIGVGVVNYGYSAKSESKVVPYDGVITGRGKINDRSVFVYAQDFSVFGGTLALKHGRKIAHIIELAVKANCPLVGIYDSGGARIQEGVNALAGCGEMMYMNTMASGIIPQISVIVGPCAGASAYSPAIMDYTYIVDEIGCMFVTGSDVVKSVTSEECTLQELGGAKVHATASGVAHFYYSSEQECFRGIRGLIGMLPASCNDKCNYNKLIYSEKSQEKINEIIPAEFKKSYNMKAVINELVDDNSFIEVHEKFATTMIVGFARLSGITIGIVANQPNKFSGVIDSDSSDKAARFVRFCDSFHIPIITFVDTPGYMPGKLQEHNGIIRHGAKLLYAYAEATTIKLTVVLRKAYGGAYIAMGSKHLHADYVYALPQAQIAVMGAEGAVSILYRRDIEKMNEAEQSRYISQKIDEYSTEFMNTNTAVEEGYVDEIIEIDQIRKKLFDDITALSNKEENRRFDKKHGNIPL